MTLRLRRFWSGLIALLLFAPSVFAGTTGKIAGQITDAVTGEPLIGAQVYIEETQQGAVTDLDGYYSIINVKPGVYTVRVTYVGYTTQTFTEVPVEVDKTFTLDVRMGEEVIEGQEVIVTAERPIVQMDRTTTTAFVDEREIQALPAVNLEEIINLQAGVVDGHFRGGREGEVMYMVNGIPVNNPYDNEQGVTIENNMVSGLEIISGVFNAEYGQAMSGVVNIVTKDAPSEWTGQVQAEVGGIVSDQDLEFVERTAPAGSELSRSDFRSVFVPYREAAGLYDRQDVQLSLGGPILKDRFGFRLTGRYVMDESSDISRRLFSPSDSSDLSSRDIREWAIESTGDQEFVQGRGEAISINSALTLKLTQRFRLDYNGFYEFGNGRDNDFRGFYSFKYVPDGLNSWNEQNQLHVGSLRMTLGSNAFANINYGFMQDVSESSLYDLPEGFESSGWENSPYVPGNHVANAALGFDMGGNQLFSYRRRTRTHTLSADYTHQLNRVHQMKSGISARLHHLYNWNYDIDVQPGGFARPSPGRYNSDTLDVRPYELAAYIQDKMEFKNLIVNAGIRYDIFQPDFIVPVDWTQAGLEQITLQDGSVVSNRQKAALRQQISPRLGLAFPVSATGVIRFSAGLFFQTPRLEWLYRNPNYEVDLEGNMQQYGNAGIDPERTLHFEIALQQGLTDALGTEITLFSKDYRNLTSEEIREDVETRILTRRFINQDVGTSRGVTLAVFQRPIGPVSWNVDYTLQFAEGSGSDPGQSFDRYLSGTEDVILIERLNWDRRHVLNNRITYAPDRSLNVTMINRWRTGSPYTTSRDRIASMEGNDGDRPSAFFSDLRVAYSPPFIPDGFQFTVQVDNLFDSRVHEEIFSTTGRADEDLTLFDYRRSGTTGGGVNSLDEYFLSPYRFAEPRTLTIGARFLF